MARLVFLTAQGRQLIELAQVNSVGRHPNNVVQLLDGVVSKEHCVVERRGQSIVLRDLGSLNGTFINGVRVNGEQVLRHGDTIHMGSTQIRFDDGLDPVRPPDPQQSVGAIHHPADAPVAPSVVPQWAVAAKPPSFAPTSPALPVAPSAAIVDRSAHAIGQQVQAQSKDFLPFDQAATDPAGLRLDYERLRITWELIREIGLERDVDKLLEKILVALFRFVKADRGVILLREPDGSLKPRAVRRRDGSQVAVEVSSTILKHVIKEKAGVLSHDASSDFAAAAGKSMFLNRISSAIVVPLLQDNEVIGALWLDSEQLASFKPKDLELLTAVGNQVAMLISNTLLARKIETEIMTRERFSRLLSPNVADQVISGKLDIKKGGVQVPDCTVFNSDLRGFTRMSEGTTPEKMVDLLNEYFELMVDTIFKYEGTLDKFMGDGIMAFWGAPVVHPDDPIRCVECSLEQMNVLDELNKKRVSLGEPPLAMGIGIQTGELVSGYVGSSKSLSYTVIGDTVNTSARLCGIAAPGQILVTQQTVHRLGNRFKIEPLAPVNLKGKEKPVPIFNVSR